MKQDPVLNGSKCIAFSEGSFFLLPVRVFYKQQPLEELNLLEEETEEYSKEYSDCIQNVQLLRYLVTVNVYIFQTFCSLLIRWLPLMLYGLKHAHTQKDFKIYL